MTYTDQLEVALLTRRLEYLINTEPSSRYMKQLFSITIFNKNQYEDVSSKDNFMNKYHDAVMTSEASNK